MTTTTTILTIGLDFTYAAAHLGHKQDITAIRAAVAHGLRVRDSIDGLQNETFYLVPDAPGVYAELEQKLRNGNTEGQTWDGVAVAWGVRAHAEMAPIFEKVVNLTKDATPKSTKLLFAGPAPDHLSSIRRNFPHLKAPKEEVLWKEWEQFV